LAEFSEPTVRALTKCLPTFGYARNPADVTGQILSLPGMLDEALEIVAREERTEALLVQLANRGPRDLRERKDLLAQVGEKHRLPIIVSMLADSLPAASAASSRRRGISVARDPADGGAFPFIALPQGRTKTPAAEGTTARQQRRQHRPLGFGMANWLESAGVPVATGKSRPRQQRPHSHGGQANATARPAHRLSPVAIPIQVVGVVSVAGAAVVPSRPASWSSLR